MKFGGHETFHIRPDWLTAGLHLLDRQPDTSWATNEASDALGVGRNMAKSIGWWLNMTGLTVRSGPREPLQISPFGRVVLAHDPYFSASATWWFVHLALVFGTSGISAPVNDRIFNWFFRKFHQTRFQRPDLIETLRTYLAKESGKIPSEKSLHRDVAVLLQTYARPIPAPPVDPEDMTDCPLRHLGLLVYRSKTDMFERRAPVSDIPPHVLAAGLGLLSNPDCSDPPDRSEFPKEPERPDRHDLSEKPDRHDLSEGSDIPDLPGRSDIALTHDGDARILARSLDLDINTLIEQIETAARILGPNLLAIRYLAGDKVASVTNMPFDHWASNHWASDHSTKACHDSSDTGKNT